VSALPPEKNSQSDQQKKLCQICAISDKFTCRLVLVLVLVLEAFEPL